MQFAYVLALEVFHAPLTPEEVLPLCSFDVGYESGEVCDRAVKTAASFVFGGICATRLPAENVDGDGEGIAGDVDLCACFPFIVPVGEEVAANLDRAPFW